MTKNVNCMPRNQFQRMIFALITVIITVHAFVFFRLYVVDGQPLMGYTDCIYMFGGMFPLWGVIVVEFICAYLLECFMGSPCSFKLASRCFNPRETHPVLFETAIISATVGLMCPAMSFLAALFYYPYDAGFDVLTLLVNFFKLFCVNFPFAFFSQLFFIQPLVRTIFKVLFRKDIESRVPQ